MTLAKLKREAARRGIVPVKESTAANYGLTLAEWLTLLESQGWGCGVCGNVPRTGRLVTDHEHVRGWKRMPPEQRKLYVRGVCCWRCNKELMPEAMKDSSVARRVMDYLVRYETRGITRV